MLGEYTVVHNWGAIPVAMVRKKGAGPLVDSWPMGDGVPTGRLSVTSAGESTGRWAGSCGGSGPAEDEISQKRGARDCGPIGAFVLGM